jgi:hypothetical protein
MSRTPALGDGIDRWGTRDVLMAAAALTVVANAPAAPRKQVQPPTKEVPR